MNENGSIPTVDRGKVRSMPRWFLLAAIAVLFLAFTTSCGGASGGASGGGGGQQAAEDDVGEAPAKEDQALGREPLGEADAPVVLTEYADYQ